MPVHLQPGDCLIYRPSSLLGRIIAIKTWSPWSHVEVAVAPGRVVAARPEGVNYYDTRWDHLGMVVRPPSGVDLPAAVGWFDHFAVGQRYDVWGLLRFFTLGRQSTDKMFCSELATRFYRAGGVEPFHQLDADLIPPGWYATLADGFTKVWADTDL